MTDFRPQVAFGLKAQALALQAKLGRKIGIAERLEPVDAHARWLVGDTDAAAAVIRFVADVVERPVDAGEAMLQFLDTWAEAQVGPHARACEDVLRAAEAERAAMPADRSFSWQSRADAGLD